MINEITPDKPIPDKPAPEPAYTPFGPDYITEQQYDILIKWLNPDRIAKRKQGNSGPELSYLEQADVRAHLTRTFGFLNWDSRVIASELVFTEPTEIGRDKKPGFEVTCTSTVQLVIRSISGRTIFDTTEAAAASNAQPNKGAAYETALKSATSDALKRCAINLGDQFGLGLYRKNDQRSAFIKGSLVNPDAFGRRVPEAKRKVVDLQQPVEHEETPALAVAEEDPYAALDAALPDDAGVVVTDMDAVVVTPEETRAARDQAHIEEAVEKAKARVAKALAPREF